jgi:hypothetical protein
MEEVMFYLEQLKLLTMYSFERKNMQCHSRDQIHWNWTVWMTIEI